MNRLTLSSVGLALAGLFVAQFCASAEDAPVKKPAAKEFVVDAEFRDAIDIPSLRKALRESNPEALSAAALKLLAAEQKLGKTHASFSGSSLLKVAVRAVSETHDLKALDALSAGLGDLKLVAEQKIVESIRPILAGSRRVFAGPDLSPQETTPEAIVLFNTLRKQIIAAKVIGNRESVEELKKSAKMLAELHTKQRGYLLKLADDSLAAMAPKSDPSTAALVDIARDNQARDTP